MSKSILTISLAASLALSASLAFGLGVEGPNHLGHLGGKTRLDLGSMSSNCSKSGTATFKGQRGVTQVNCTLNNHSQSATVTTQVKGFNWHYGASRTIYSKYVGGAFYSTTYGQVVRCYGGTWKISSNNTTAVCKYGNETGNSKTCKKLILHACHYQFHVGPLTHGF